MPQPIKAEIQKYLNDLYQFALCLCHDPIEAEDLTQETCLRAVRNAQSFKSGASFKPWIFAILTNLFIDSKRKKKRETPLSSLQKMELTQTTSPPQFSLENLQDYADHVEDPLKNTIEKMPKKHKLVFLLHTLGEFSYQEIAKILNCPLGTVMSRLHRARCYLKQNLPPEISPPNHNHPQNQKNKKKWITQK